MGVGVQFNQIAPLYKLRYGTALWFTVREIRGKLNLGFSLSISVQIARKFTVMWCSQRNRLGPNFDDNLGII